MATTTRSRKAAAPVTTEPKKRTTVTELPESYAAIFAELSEISLRKGELIDREKDLKQQIKDVVGEPLDKKHTIAIRVGGVLRAKIGLRGRSGLDSDKLRAAFPEAYESCQTETEYAVITPA